MLIMDKKITAMETEEGDGARVKRLFPGPRLMHFDPFVLFDEFFLSPSAGFPRHPHRGFEALTFMLDGGFHHSDTLGNDSTVFAGGVQYFSAGKGIEHSEMPGTEELNHGIQLWVNLPKRLKDTAPSYRLFKPEDLPVRREDEDSIERIIVGPPSPVRLHTDITYRYIALMPGGSHLFHVPEGMRGIIYLVSGGIIVQGEQLDPGDASLLDRVREAEISAARHSHFILLAGKPHNEPIHQHGSFVD